MQTQTSPIKAMDILHSYSWVIVNNKYKDKPMFNSLENVESFRAAGFKVQMVYYISNSLSSVEKNEIEQNLKNQNIGMPLKNFEEILEEDVQGEDQNWVEVANKTKMLFAEIEKMENINPSSKICFFVDVIKFYMAYKTQVCALDLNCKLIDEQRYKNILEKTRTHVFAERRTLFENKICYVNDLMANKMELEMLNKILDDLYLSTDKGYMESIRKSDTRVEDWTDAMILDYYGRPYINNNTVYEELRTYFNHRSHYCISQQTVEAVMKETSYEQVNTNYPNESLNIEKDYNQATTSELNNTNFKSNEDFKSSLSPTINVQNLKERKPRKEIIVESVYTVDYPDKKEKTISSPLRRN